jgi:hypothetical protein
MPILTSNYIASWYVVSLNGKNRLLEGWNESLEQEVNNKALIQGDIGTHLMDISGVYYKAQISSPVILMSSPNTNFYDAFDIVLEGLSVAQLPIDDTIAASLDYVLDSATVTINPEGINVNCNIENSVGWVGQKQYFGDNYNDFTGRTARFYDCIFNFLGGEYLVNSAELQIKVNLEKMYFIGQSQIPTYAITGYSVTGSASILVTPDSYDYQTLISLQTPGVSAPLAREVSLTILDQYSNNGLGYRQLYLGEFMNFPSVSLDIKPNQTIQATVNFNTYFRRSSYLGNV